MNLKGKRILITGGCGFLGTHICQGLAKKEIQELKKRVTKMEDILEKN